MEADGSATPLMETLPNGARVCAYHVPHANTEHIGVWVRCGSWNDPQGLNGATHFLEHLLWSPQFEDRTGASEVGFVDGPSNAFTAAEYTAAIAQVPVAQVRQALHNMTAGYRVADFHERAVEIQRRVILNEIDLEARNTSLATYLHLETAMWHGILPPPSPAGTRETVNRLTPASLASHYRSAFRVPQKIVIVGVGGCDPPKFLQEAVECFRSVPTTCFDDAVQSNYRPNLPAFIGLLSPTPSMSVETLYGFGFLVGDEVRDSALSVLGIYLDLELHRILRQSSGLVYALRAGANLFSGRSLLTVSTTSRWSETETVHKTVTQVLETMSQYSLGKTTLAYAKRLFLTRAMIRRDELKGLGSSLGKCLLFGRRLLSVSEVNEALTAMSVDYMSDLAQSVIRGENLVVSCCSPAPPTFLARQRVFGKMPVAAVL